MMPSFPTAASLQSRPEGTARRLNLAVDRARAGRKHRWTSDDRPGVLDHLAIRERVLR